jgi:hypothetical protein
MHTSTFSIRRAERPALRMGAGAWQTGRVYADFVADDMPLSIYAHRRGDLISCLGWGPRPAQDEAIARLLGDAPPDFPWGGGRTALYVCPEDGDLHCGAVTAVIERDGDAVVWRAFGYETGLDTDPPDLDTQHLETLGPFRFSWSEYEAAIRAGYGLDSFDAEGRRP